MTKTLIHGTSALVAALLLAGAAHAAQMLAAKNGMTLYVYDKDTGGLSTCYDDCARQWPPYTAKADDSAIKNWTLVKRNDGSMQWAYDGKPVYFYADDKKSGDKNGDGKGGVWHIVTE